MIRNLAVLAAGISCLSLSQTLSAQGVARNLEFRLTPSDERESEVASTSPNIRVVNNTSLGFSCYNIRTGRQSRCSMTYTLVGVGGFGTVDDCTVVNGRVQAGTCAHGGHVHESGSNRPRPLIVDGFRNDSVGEVFLVGDDPSNGALVAEGFTDTPNPPFLTNTVRHDVSQASGYYEWQLVVLPPFRSSFLAQDVFPDGTIRIEGRTFVRVPDLIEVEPQTGVVARGRNPDVNHRDADAFFLTEPFVSVIRDIGRDFTSRTGRVFSINDGSLPLGGVFDLGRDWDPSHKTHRAGEQVDINVLADPACLAASQLAYPNDQSRWTSRCNCELDDDLFVSVNKFLIPVNRRSRNPRFQLSALLCESDEPGLPDGRKHLNMTQLVSP